MTAKQVTQKYNTEYGVSDTIVADSGPCFEGKNTRKHVLDLVSSA